MSKINPAQATMIDRVSRLKEEASLTETRVRARVEREVRLETAGAWQRLDDALAEAHESGVPIRRLMVAYGTSNFTTVKERIDAGKVRRLDIPEIVEGARQTLIDYLTIEQSPTHDGAWRIIATEVPAALWTYPPLGGDAYPVIPTAYSAYMDVEKTGQNFVSTRGHNSDPKGPLHLEWARGKGNIRDILKTVEA